MHAAFSSVPRERFLGHGPWKVLARTGYLDTPSDDVTFVYRDLPVAIDYGLGINNGQPSLHAICLAAVDIAEGETVIHVGTGTGYYTAILAQLTGLTGCVYGFEIHAKLALRSRENLSDTAHIQVLERSGSEGQLPSADVVYVSAGATAPQPNWLDALRVGGRLLFPLTAAHGSGGMLLVKRTTAQAFDARFLSPAMFIGCAGARDEEAARRLTDAFSRGDSKDVKSLRRNADVDDSCWFAGSGWWLSTAANRRN